MRKTNSKIVIIAGFSLILILLCFISLLAWYNISGNNRSLDEIVEKEEKFDEIFTMRDVAHQRVLLLYIMANTDDIFERDELYMQYLNHADVFMQARDRFRSHAEGETAESDYVDSWNKVSTLVKNGAGAQNRVLKFIEDNQIEQAKALLHSEVIPNQKRVIAGYTYLLDSQHSIIEEKLKAVQKINQNHLLLIITLGTAALLTGILIAFYVTRYNTMIQNDLVSQTNAAQQANTAKSYFLANMSHEIRTPLASIIGFSEALLEKDGNKQQTEAIGTIVRNGRHLQQIINDILDISKIEAGQLVTERIQTSFFHILSEIDSLMGAKATDKGLGLNINYHFPLPHNITSDPTRLKQILINLCNNAIKFTHHGEVNIDVSYDNEITSLLFSVTDTGIGMAQEEVENIFNPFTQADSTTTREYGGTGLGLSISSKLAGELRGELACKSRRNEGSTFTLSLVIDKHDSLVFINHPDEVSEQFEEPPHHIEIKQLEGSILLVEDTPDNQQLIEMYINRTGASLSIVENGLQAVEAGTANIYDLILMDTQMPEMDGIEATRLLRANGYNKPIVSLTANAMISDREKCIAAGVDEYLVKPLDLQQFYDVLNKYLTETDNTINNGKASTTSYNDLDADLKNNPQYQAMVARFLDKLPGLIDEISDSIQNHEWGHAQLKSHDLKGMGGAMGFPRITEIASLLNTQIKKSEFDAAFNTCNQLEIHCQNIFEKNKAV